MPIIIDSAPIDHVDNYIYLGHQMSFDLRMKKQIDRRVRNIWNKGGHTKYYIDKHPDLDVLTAIHTNICSVW